MSRSIVPRNNQSTRAQVPLRKRAIHHTYRQATIKVAVPVAPFHSPVKL